MQPLRITSEIYQAILAHCRGEAPLECCGVVGGKERFATSFFPFCNILASENRYEADPADIIKAVQKLRSRGEEFVAIYHSHPQWKAVPSKTDLERNGYGELPQIIVGLTEDPPEVRAWRYQASSFDEIPLIVEGPAVEATNEGR